MKKIINFLICCTVIFYVQFSNGQIEFRDIGINVNYGIAQYGGGVTFCDFDNDGWDDLAFGTEQGEPIKFYKNYSGVFTRIYPTISDPMSETRQLTWADFDNDGDKDLFVTSLDASNKLYRNDGSLNFTDITVAAGFDTSVLYTDGASWGDYNNDGFLDIFLSSRDPNQIIPNRLYKNNGDGTFTNVSVAAGIKQSDGDLSYCASFFDYDKDGYLDIYVANDKSNNTNTLYHNNGDGTFSDVSSASGTGVAIDAMSTTIGDYNNDGWPDIYVTNTKIDNGNRLFRNNGDGTFTNVALQLGVDFDSIAWGAVFLDADNDLDLDLYVSGMLDGSNGWLPSAFYENIAGSYVIPTGAGFENDDATSFSNAIGDINNDGKPDMVVVNFEPRNNFLWQNISSNTNNWIKIKLEGTTSNKDGVGSVIELTVGGNTYYRYTLAGEGYQSQNSYYEFFGLSNFTSIDMIKVKWLSGIEDILTNVGVNQSINIVEGATLSVNSYAISTFNIYPNPVSDQLYISNTSKTYKADIFTLDGKLVRSNISIDGFKNQINVENLSEGVYIIKLKDSGNAVYGVQKFIKN